MVIFRPEVDGEGGGQRLGGVVPLCSLTPGEGLGWEAEVLLEMCSFPSLLEGECERQAVVFCRCRVYGR